MYSVTVRLWKYLIYIKCPFFLIQSRLTDFNKLLSAAKLTGGEETGQEESLTEFLRKGGDWVKFPLNITGENLMKWGGHINGGVQWGTSIYCTYILLIYLKVTSMPSTASKHHNWPHDPKNALWWHVSWIVLGFRPFFIALRRTSLISLLTVFWKVNSDVSWSLWLLHTSLLWHPNTGVLHLNIPTQRTSKRNRSHTDSELNWRKTIRCLTTYNSGFGSWRPWILTWKWLEIY